MTRTGQKVDRNGFHRSNLAGLTGGYITPGHSAAVRARGHSAVHRLSFQALCYEGKAVA